MPHQTKPPQSRRHAPQQIDLFAGGPWTCGDIPIWSGLPAQTQAALVELMTRLILDHADRGWLSATTEAGHDL